MQQLGLQHMQATEFLLNSGGAGFGLRRADFKERLCVFSFLG